MRRSLALFAVAAGFALAQPSFLTSLEGHPQLQAARAQLQARELSKRLAPNWISLDARGGWSRRELDDAEPCPFLNDPDPTNDIFCDFISPDIPSEAGQGQVGVTLRPLPFGDYADQVRLRALDRAEAALDYRIARSNFEAAALRAALDAAEAERGLAVAKQALALAEEVYTATRLRVRKGAASDQELRTAQQNLDEARNRVTIATEGLALARTALLSFTDEPPPPTPWFRTPLPTGEAPAVVRARIRLERARTGLTNASRDFWPTLELGYQANLDDHNAVGVTLETRTLGTRIYYGYNSFADAARERTASEWRVGARLNVSVNTWSRFEAARLQIEAARAALEAALRRTAVEKKRYDNALEQSVRAVELAERRFANAEVTEADVQRRVELGLRIPLDLQRARLNTLEAGLALLRARHDVLRAQLDYLVYLALPPSEAWR